MNKIFSLTLTAAILVIATLLTSRAQEVNPITPTIDALSVPGACNPVGISTFAPTSLIVSTNAAARFIDILNVDTQSNFVVVGYSSVTISTNAGSMGWQMYPPTATAPGSSKRFSLAPRQNFYGLARATTAIPVYVDACTGR